MQGSFLCNYNLEFILKATIAHKKITDSKAYFLNLNAHSTDRSFKAKIGR